MGDEFLTFNHFFETLYTTGLLVESTELIEETVKRPRKLGDYTGAKPHIYQDLDQFLGSKIGTGIHSFQKHGRMVDLLLEERDSDTLLVFFTAAVEAGKTWPYFSGRGIGARTGHNLLAISDPSIAVDNRLSTNWTLGDSSYQFHKDVPQIVRKIAGDKRIVFVGASAGGFPALYYGSMFPESVSFVMNPRTNVFTPPTHIQHSAKHLFPGLSAKEIAELIPTKLGKAKNTVVYYQNCSDDRYYGSHAVPYLNNQGGTGNVYWKLGEWGDGHVAPNSKEIAETIQALTQADTWADGAVASNATLFVDIEDFTNEHLERGFGSEELSKIAADLITVGGLESRILALAEDFRTLQSENTALRQELIQLGSPKKEAHVPSGCTLGKNVNIDPTVRLMADPKSNPISIGDNTKILPGAEWIGPIKVGTGCYFNKESYLRAEVTIGNDVLVGPFVKFVTDSHEIGPKSKRGGPYYRTSITVGDGVWIGASVTIVGNVSIGAGAVVAAGSLVNKDVPANTMVGGVPAKKIKDLE